MAIMKDAGTGQSRYKPVLEVSWKEKGKHIYLLDPSEEIKIGRDFDANQICIRRETVSNEHCLIAMHNGVLTVQDLNSSNGTFIKRGMKRYRVNGRVYVNNGDCLLIGGVSMKLQLFIFDAAYI
ncbi:MAG: FHA domain-containing protein [Mogibacterium sp.]|nr:FHA domain-containing protein [Mogibacterium sp.]